MADETTASVEAAVIYRGQEYYVATQASADRTTLATELLQCQLLSLVGVAPDDQLLLSSRGQILFSPRSASAPTIVVSADERPRFFLFSAADSGRELPEMMSDWSQICTKSTFGDAVVAQPAFRKASADSDVCETLICAPCAQTCTTAFQPVTPVEWKASKTIASRFISDIAVVAGDVDASAPPGFTKIPTDLNFSASGDYIYLCVKRGGPCVLTQLHVLFQNVNAGDTLEQKLASKTAATTPGNVLGVDCNSGGLASDGHGVSVHIGYDSVLCKGNMEQQLDTVAITDIAAVVGDAPPPSPAYVKITRNLNEGSAYAQPVYLYYKLAPLGGFVCNSGREHSEFGECLFASRHLAGLSSTMAMDEQRLTTALPVLAAQRNRNDAAFMEAYYRQRQPGMLKRLQSGLQRAQSYENKEMQAEALKRIPLDKLHERARTNPSPMPLYQDELARQLLHWFKREFFTWMNQPRCSSCNHDKTRSVRTEGPSTAEEIAGQAGRVEVYQCPACGAFTRFPRYNDPVKLLDTRTGRCGEWANCFTLCCRAMGFEARYVLDVTDHVWTEIYSEHFKRWLHADSCEDQLDCPLTYEVGWGKKLSYIFSFAHDEVVDTARRYTQNWAEMRTRRQDVSEAWLQSTIEEINRALWGQQSAERVAVLTSRAQAEREELIRGRTVTNGEVKGRVSGSAEWKSQRSEDGKQTANAAITSGSEAAMQKKPASASPSISMPELLQEICRNLVVGCHPPFSDCTNPYCFNGRSSMGSLALASETNERAAQAIQVVSTLSTQGLSTEALAMLTCPTNSLELRWFMWKQQPWVYLPLQDSPSATGSKLLVDISGYENHANNEQRCALRKPFRIPHSGHAGSDRRDEDAAFGVQLLPGQQLDIPVKSSVTSRCTLSFLARLDKGTPSEDKSEGKTGVLTVRLGAPVADQLVIFRVVWDHVKQQLAYDLLQQNRVSSSGLFNSPPLVFGAYAHIAITQDGSDVEAYVNGAKVTRLQVNPGEVGPTLTGNAVTLEGPELRGERTGGSSTCAAVISHVAVMPVVSRDALADFCATMKQHFVCAPPLKAYGPNGERSGQRCLEKAAGGQSGYRASQVKLWGGQFFDGLQFVYERTSEPKNADDPARLQVVQGELVGNDSAKRRSSAPTVTLNLLPGEVVTRVSGRSGAWTDCVRLHTNFGRNVVCGGKGGGDFSVPTPTDSEIRAISFKVGGHLTDITAFVLDASPLPSLQESDTMKDLERVLLPAEPGFRHKAISAALRYLGNIGDQPDEPKFQRIRASNKFFNSNVGTLGDTAAEEFMRWCGFCQEHLEGEELFYCFYPKQSDEEQEHLPAQDLAEEAQTRAHFLKAFEDQHPQ